MLQEELFHMYVNIASMYLYCVWPNANDSEQSPSLGLEMPIRKLQGRMQETHKEYIAVAEG